MEEKKREIRNLSLLFLFSFLTAGLIAAYLILELGPTGRYIGKNTVLSPDLLGKKSLNIDREAYTKFYLTIAGDESVDEKQIPPSLFEKPAAVITIEGLQRIEFAPDGDHYRVELVNNGGWAYFKHKGILWKGDFTS
jgi:hypothetical protein